MAYYRALKAGIRPEILLNFINRDGKGVMSHGVPPELIRAQAKSLGIPVIQRPVTWESYEENFIEVVSSLSKQGITTGIFGDIDLEEHRKWIEETCEKANVNPILPLWMEDQGSIVKEFLSLGFKAVIVFVKPGVLDASWVGRPLDFVFLEALERAGVSPCGEKGEYHTFVVDGPCFRQGLRFRIPGVATDLRTKE